MMSGIDGIIAEIEAKAREKAARIVSAAESERENALAQAHTRLEKAVTEREASLAAEADEIIRRRVTLARPQGRMATLAAKQAELEAVFAGVRGEMRRDKKVYADFWLRLAAKYSEDGDEVRVDESDADILDKKWTDKLAAVSGKKLARGKTVRKGGGLILAGKSSEKDLSFPTVLEEYRGLLERETAEMLFKD